MAYCELEEFLILTALLEDGEKERNEKSRKWVHEVNTARKLQSEFHALYPLLRSQEEELFLYFRMNFEYFDELLNLIKENEYTHYRKPIDPMERLAVALRFLAADDSHSFRVGFHCNLAMTSAYVHA